MPSPAPSTPIHGVALSRDLGMRARDGVRLATDVWRPASAEGEPLPGPFPAVLVRTPYGRTRDGYQRDGEFWARHGYVMAVQDVRGRFDSEGEFVLLANEGPDGYDAIEWVASLPYTDGRVGTYGTSYSGWLQNAAAIERPPHLRAMWVTYGGSNGNTSALRHNGAFELRWLTWAVSHGITSPEARRDPALQRRLIHNAEGMFQWLRRLPWGEGDDDPLRGLEGYGRWARDLYEQGDAGEFWLQRGLNFEPYVDESADVPAMYCGGWYDSYTRATVENFEWQGPRLEHQYLLMGPWTHSDPSLDRSWAGEVDLGPEASMPGGLGGRRQVQLLRWFDRWLRDVTPPAHEPLVRYFVMGGGAGGRTAEGRLQHGGHWRSAETWPPPEARPLDLYLQPGGVLGTTPPAGGAASTYRFDPADPLPTVSANTSSLNELVPPPPRVANLPSPITLVRVMTIQGGADQRTREDTLGARPPFGPLEDRADVLLFETEPLADDLEVTGPVEATVYFESDAPDTDLFVMLQDAYPPSDTWPEGYRLNVCDGILRLRYREGTDRPAPLTPGEVVEARFALYPTSNRFVRGHRLRVLVSSSSFPRFDVNPNTGEPLGRHTSMRVATNTVHHSARYPSKVTLSVMPAEG